MFLNQQKKTQILESSDLQTLLKAISNNSEVLTESEISTVSSIENYIKEDTKLVLSEDARIIYKDFMNKVNILEEGVMDVLTTIGRVLKYIFLPNIEKDPIEEEKKYFNKEYKTNYNSFSPEKITELTQKILSKNEDSEKRMLSKIISTIINNCSYEMRGEDDKELVKQFKNEMKIYKDCLEKLK